MITHIHTAVLYKSQPRGKLYGPMSPQLHGGQNGIGMFNQIPLSVPVMLKMTKSSTQGRLRFVRTIVRESKQECGITEGQGPYRILEAKPRMIFPFSPALSTSCCDERTSRAESHFKTFVEKALMARRE